MNKKQVNIQENINKFNQLIASSSANAKQNHESQFLDFFFANEYKIHNK